MITNYDKFDKFNPFGGGGSSLIKRYFTELASAGSQYYTIPSVTLSGDFEIEFDVYKSSFATTDSVLATVAGASADFIAIIASTGNIHVKTNGTGIGFLTNPLIINKLNHVKVARVGGDITVTVNGIAETQTVGIADVTFDLIAAIGTPAFFNGIVSNVKITDAGTLVRWYEIKETWAGASTTLNDRSGNAQHGTAVNITAADSQRYTFNGNASPNIWTGEDTTVIEVAGT